MGKAEAEAREVCIWRRGLGTRARVGECSGSKTSTRNQQATTSNSTGSNTKQVCSGTVQ